MVLLPLRKPQHMLRQLFEKRCLLFFLSFLIMLFLSTFFDALNVMIFKSDVPETKTKSIRKSISLLNSVLLDFCIDLLLRGSELSPSSSSMRFVMVLVISFTIFDWFEKIESLDLSYRYHLH